MPLLGLLIKALFLYGVSLLQLLQSTKYAVRMAAVLILAAAYVACATAFTVFIQPMLEGQFNAGSYGTVMGMAFPPISGTIIFGLVGLWGCIVVIKYVVKFTSLLLP